MARLRGERRMNPLQNLKWLLVCISLVMILSEGVVSASGCGTLPSSVSSLTTSCIPINITNSQTSATPTSFQQMFTFNALAYQSYLAGSLQNIYVYNSLSGIQMPAWIEGNVLNEGQTTSLNTAANVIIWVNLGANTIGASSSANDIYYLGVGSTSTNFFISGNQIGEAPQLSSTYAEYDNGANVFPTLYQNFAGTSIPSGWVSTGAVTINNGYTIGTALGAYITSSASFGANSNQILDAYISQQGSSATMGLFFGYVGTSTSGTLSTGIAMPNNNQNGGIPCFYVGSGCASITLGTGIISIYAPSSSTGTYQLNYGSAVSSSGTSTLPIQVGSTAQNGGSPPTTPLIVQYIRIRTYPPSGVMPTVSFGTIQSPSSLGLTISSNPTTYPSSTTLTATCTPSTDTCDVVSGTSSYFKGVLCSGTGSCTNTIPTAYLGAGTYTPFWANDITLGTNTLPQTYTVDTGTPTETCTENGASVSAGETINSLYANDLVSCTIGSLNNQVSGSLVYNGVTESTGSTLTYNALWNDQNANTWNAIVATSANYIANSLAWDTNFLLYQVSSISPPAATGYETQAQTFTYNLYVTQAASTANTFLDLNGIQIANDLQTVSAGPQAFTFTYTIPLLSANDVTWQYNGILTAYFTGAYSAYNPTSSGVFNTINQNSVWNYFPSATATYANTILGENQTIDVVLADTKGIGLATYSGSLTIGNVKNIQEQQSSNYHYYSNIYSFIPTSYGLTNPTVVNSLPITVNAIVQLAYNGNTVWRNTSTTFVSTNESLHACTAPWTTNSIAWTYYVVPSLAQYTGNVYMQGYYQLIKNSYVYNTLAGSASGFPTPGSATSDRYDTCVFPSWAGGNANYGVSGYYQYNASTYPTSQYYLINQLMGNTLTNIHLNLANITTPILYSIAVQQGSTYIPAYVQILQFIPNTNSTALINEIHTPAGGTAQAYLRQGTTYQFEVYSLAGKLLEQTPNYQAQSCSSQPCLLVIYIGNSTIQSLPNSIGNLKYSCVQTNTNTTHPSNYKTSIACTFSSINGASYNVSLAIQKSFFSLNPPCIRTLIGASGTLTCTVNQTNDTNYAWTFSVNLGAGPIPLLSGYFGVQGDLYGNLGIFLALIIIIAFTALPLYTTKNIIFSLVGLDAGVSLTTIIRMLPMPIWIVGILQILVALVIWAITR